MYIELQKGKFAKNQKVNDFMVIDMDKKGKVLGIELINLSKQVPAESLAEIHVKNAISA